MRTRDIEIGETYLTEVPLQLPEARYPRPATTGSDWLPWWQLTMLRGTRLPLTVIDIDASASKPTVDGIRSLTISSIVVALTPEQCLELGLGVPVRALSVRHEALFVRMEVRDRRRFAVVAVG